MNLYDAALMHAPSMTPGYCVVCGATDTTMHHVVPRSRGGKNGPVLELCGSGTTGCHGKAEDKRLHLRYEGRWEALETRTATKYATALEMQGWKRL